MERDGGDPEALLRHFREAFAADPTAAYRDWYRAQEELADENRGDEARALADDLWELKNGLAFPTADARARFLHNAAVFYGSPGAAADLGRARELFDAALAHFRSAGDEGWRARVEHNFATALSNLGANVRDLEESVELFHRALAWRTSEREIARGVSLHNLGLALRRLAELDPPSAAARLSASAAALEEACVIRERHGLREGRASSLFQRGVTLLRLGEEKTAGGGLEADVEADIREAARECLENAARELERLEKHDSAAAARSLLPR
jgi:hypothetical protein